MAYVVKKGDSLSAIAKQNGMTLKKLLELNKDIKNPDYIQIGQKINLTNSSPTGKKIYDNNDGYPITPKNISPSWNKVTKGAGNPTTTANFKKSPPSSKKQLSAKKDEKPSFLEDLKQDLYEKYQDFKTAIDQQVAPKNIAKSTEEIDDSFIDYGYKELGTYKDESYKAGKTDSLLSAINVFDNDKGFDYVVSPKIKEGSRTYKNVKGVAHFLMDSDITPNQKYTDPYIEKGGNKVESAAIGKFTPYIGSKPTDYVMYYKNIDGDRVNVKYGQLKDKDKYKGYEQIKVRSVPFADLDFNKKTSAGFLKKASYIGTKDGKQTSIITDPDSNDVYGRFSGGSGIFYFKEPKTGKTLSVDVSGSVNIIKMVGDQLSKKYGVDPKNLQFLYHDMGSYSAKPKSHNGVLSNEQWENYNVNNKGYSGAALMYPMEYGGEIKMEHGGWIKNAIKHPGRCTPGSPNYDCPKGSPQWNLAQRFKHGDLHKKEDGGYATSDNIDMGYYTNPVKYFAAKGANIPTSLDNYKTKLNSKEESKFLKWRSTLPENLQNENDYDLRGYYKEYGNKPIPKGIEPHLTDEFKLPNHPTFSENSRYYNDETSYLGGKWDNGLYQWKYTPNSEFKNEVIEQKGFDEVRNDFILNNHNILSRNPNIFKKYGGYIENDCLECGGRIKAENGLNPKPLVPTKPEQIDFEMERQLPPGVSYERDVKKFSWNNRDTSPEQIKLDSSYMLYKTPKGYSNVYQDGKLIGYTVDNKVLIPGEPNFEDGGLVRAWIQKFMKGGYIAEDGYPNAQELTQPTTNYYNWGNYGNQNSFLTPDQINQKPFENPYQNMNLQQPNVPQFNIPKGQEIEPLTSIGAQKMTPDLQGIRNRVNQSMQDIAPKSKSPMNMNAVNMGLDIGTQSMSAAANLMGSLGKDNSKAQAFGQGASGAMNVASQVTAPFKDIPIAGKAIDAVGKTLGFFIGGALGARRQGIENEEMNKYNKVQEYTSRNMQTIQQPSYYGQYMSKYGSNIKNLEKRLMDDIFSDFDKYMKLT